MTDIDHAADTPPEYQAHIGSSRQYMRDVILGVNDGLVSTFLLVSAVVGGGLDATQVLLTGVAGAVAGMISMSIGEYLATKSQDEVFDAEIALEKIHLRDLAEAISEFTTAPSPIDDENSTVLYRSIDLLWRPVGRMGL